MNDSAKLRIELVVTESLTQKALSGPPRYASVTQPSPAQAAPPALPTAPAARQPATAPIAPPTPATPPVVNVAPPPAPTVNVPPPIVPPTPTPVVNVPAPIIPPVPAPVVNVPSPAPIRLPTPTAPIVNVPPVNVPAPVVNVPSVSVPAQQAQPPAPASASVGQIQQDILNAARGIHGTLQQGFQQLLAKQSPVQGGATALAPPGGVAPQQLTAAPVQGPAGQAAQLGLQDVLGLLKQGGMGRTASTVSQVAKVVTGFTSQAAGQAALTTTGTAGATGAAAAGAGGAATAALGSIAAAAGPIGAAVLVAMKSKELIDTGLDRFRQSFEAAGTVLSFNADKAAHGFVSVAEGIPIFGDKIAGIGHAMLDLQQSVIGTTEKMAQFSGVAAASMVEREVAQLQRDISRANRFGEDFAQLNGKSLDFQQKVEDILDRLAPLFINFAGNTLEVLTRVAGGVEAVLATVARSLDAIITLFERLVPFASSIPLIGKLLESTHTTLKRIYEEVKKDEDVDLLGGFLGMMTTNDRPVQQAPTTRAAAPGMGPGFAF